MSDYHLKKLQLFAVTSAGLQSLPVPQSAKSFDDMYHGFSLGVYSALRTFEHEKITRLASHSRVPVINGLTDWVHPCQLLADMQTWLEHRGDMRGKTAAWIGDGNNMCNSYINAARQLDFKLNIACPEDHEPDSELLKLAGDRVSILRDPR